MSSPGSPARLLRIALALLIGTTACARAVHAPAPATIPSAGAPRWPAELAGSKRTFALLVNADREERHKRNIRDAKRALIARGMPAAHIVVVSHDTGDASASSLRRAIASLAARLNPDDGIVIYMTGHGAPEGVVLSDGVLGHAELVDRFEPFKAHRAVFVFDACHAGTLPRRFAERGFRGLAMSPTAEGEVSHCQWFAPKLWSALEHRFDSDGDDRASFVDAFRLGIAAYNQQRRDQGLGVVDGAVSMPIPELRHEAELSGDAVIVALTAKWCGACVLQARQLAYLRLLLGPGIVMYTVDIDENSLAGRLAEDDLGAVPVVLFMAKGRVKGRIVGARPTLTLLSETSKAFGPSIVNATATLDELLARLDSSNRIEVRFAVKNLAWMVGRDTLVQAVEAKIVRAFVSEVRLLKGRDLREFAEAVRFGSWSTTADARPSRATGYAALVDRLGIADRGKLAAVHRRHFAHRIRESIQRLEQDDDDARAQAWLGLWRLAVDRGATLEAFAPWLWRLRRLSTSGDAEQQRIAGFVLARIAELPDVAGRKPAQVSLRFDGAKGVAHAELSRAVDHLERKHEVGVDGMMTLAPLLALGHYYDLGYLDAAVHLTGSGVARGGGAELVMSVVEGPRYRWSSLEIREVGSRGTTMPLLGGEAAVTSLMTLPRKAFASRSQLSKGVTAIERHYRDAGYGRATVSPELACDPATRTCQTTVTIERGPRMRIHTVHLSGGGAVSQRRLAAAVSVAEGAWFSESNLEATRQRLRALPDVKDVSVSVVAGASVDSYDVHIELETY